MPLEDVGCSCFFWVSNGFDMDVIQICLYMYYICMISTSHNIINIFPYGFNIVSYGYNQILYHSVVYSQAIEVPSGWVEGPPNIPSGYLT